MLHRKSSVIDRPRQRRRHRARSGPRHRVAQCRVVEVEDTGNIHVWCWHPTRRADAVRHSTSSSTAPRTSKLVGSARRDRLGHRLHARRRARCVSGGARAVAFARCARDSAERRGPPRARTVGVLGSMARDARDRCCRRRGVVGALSRGGIQGRGWIAVACDARTRRAADAVRLRDYVLSNGRTRRGW